ncbi:AfsR/SARP family transcriptional regulator [Lentzea sp.]|uniref:AfsR/SARP family transcriptional regulator n=1 Tax=Lentzea sp. TaxID=56099 RepID=UPI002BCFD5B9|nr:BTAD domain-containing putative transcriptional regulator [Lentzea sp.]HUQ61447.1 BTAD domain-containing putative transcriptional regulator [Lentzea sp.]
MEFNVLGALEVDTGTGPVRLGSAKLRTLLAVLLCGGREPSSVHRLLHALWGEDPPRTAAENLRGYVHQLRRALGDPARVEHRPPGYALVVRPGELDSARFEDLVERGRVASTAGDLEVAGTLLRQGLALWRGTPFADVDEVDVLRDEAARLLERRQAALEARVEVDLALGRHHDLVAELSRLVSLHPLRERVRGQLMLALYRSGRQGEALTVAREGHQLLVAELGLEPGPALRRLEQAILTADPTLDLTTGTPVEAGGPGRAVPRQLPAPVAGFVGRAAQLKRLSEVLDAAGAHGGTVAIGGTAGIGKTTLAVRWAHQVVDRFPDGQLYVDLRGFDPDSPPADPADVLQGFLDALGVPPDRVPAGLTARSALYRSLIAGRAVLVLLDNARDAEQVQSLLPGGSACHTVITSRIELTGLVVRHGAHPLALDALDDDEAMALLASRLGADRVAAEPDAADELIRHCARLPLALAIVAARAATRPTFPLRVPAEELRDERRRLDALDAGDPMTSVRAVFSWSYQRIGSGAARAFRLLGLHPGPDIGLPAAACLTGGTAPETRAALAELTRANLLQERGPGRFSFHDLLRTYAGDQAAAHDAEEDRHAALLRLLDHYLHTADRVDRVLAPNRDHLALPPPPVPVEEPADAAQAWRWYEVERHVLAGAIAHAANAGLHTHAWRLQHLLTTCFDRRGHWHEWVVTGQVALAAARLAGDVDGQGRLHQGLGRALALLGRHEEAQPHLARALGLHRDVGDLVQQAHTEGVVAWSLEHQGRVEEAVRHSERALAAYQEAGHQYGQAKALNMVGWHQIKLGDHRSALRNCGQALTLYGDLGDQRGCAHTWDSIAYAHQQLGNHNEAIAGYLRALNLYRDLHDYYYESGTLTRLGDTQYAAGDAEAARVTWRQALHLLDDLHHPDAAVVRAKLEAPNAAGDR